MASFLNDVKLIGNISKINGGVEGDWVSFIIACDQRNGGTDFVPCMASNNTATTILKYGKVGRLILIDGEVRSRMVNGEPQFFIECSRTTFLDDPHKYQSNADYQGPSYGHNNKPQQQNNRQQAQTTYIPQQEHQPHSSRSSSRYAGYKR